MHRIAIALFVLVLELGLMSFDAPGQNPYESPLKVKEFTALAVALPAKSVGKKVLREKPALAVEIQVQVEDYLPRALEPVLLIDGVRANSIYRVVGVDGSVTTLGFIVEKPELLKENATLTVQMGDEEKTRSRVPGELRREKIKSLSDEQTRQFGLPALTDWLKQP